MRTILMAVVLAGCASSSNYWVSYTPVHNAAAGTQSAAVQKAVIAITDAGHEVESSDNGIVLSKWFSGDGFGGDQNRFRVRVVVDDAAKYEIVSQCQAKSAATSAWGDGCDETKRPRFVVDLMTRIDGALH